MSRDFKKEFKEFYVSQKNPYILNIPPFSYISFLGKGECDESNPSFKEARETVIYLVKYIKNNLNYDGAYEFVLPPEEILFYNRNARKENLEWRFMIRVPEFFSERDFLPLINSVKDKKKLPFTKAEFFTLNEGFAVQVLHTGSSSSIRKSLQTLTDYAAKYGYKADEVVHEIYLTDRKRTKDEKKEKRTVRIKVSL